MFAKYKITFEDGTDLQASGRKADAIRFERQFKIPVAAMFSEEGVRQEHLWFFGWCAAKRVNPDIVSFDDWIDTVESVDIVTVEEEEPTPTDPSSSPSL
jgi:hypothetical protein